jgi:hypothetical protein
MSRLRYYTIDDTKNKEKYRKYWTNYKGKGINIAYDRIGNVLLLPIGKISSIPDFNRYIEAPTFVDIYLLQLSEQGYFEYNNNEYHFVYSFDDNGRMLLENKKYNFIFYVLIQTNPSMFGNLFGIKRMSSEETKEYKLFLEKARNREMTTINSSEQQQDNTTTIEDKLIHSHNPMAPTGGGKRKTKKMLNCKRGPWSSRARASRRVPILRKRRLRRSRRGW